MLFLSVALGTNHSIYFYGPEDGVRIPPGMPIENRLTVRVERFLFCRKNPRSAHFPLFECAIEFIRRLHYAEKRAATS